MGIESIGLQGGATERKRGGREGVSGIGCIKPPKLSGYKRASTFFFRR